ncbi:MAG: hypothetical protein R3B53_01540 [Candidatus Paceibacterota bacterium]
MTLQGEKVMNRSFKNKTGLGFVLAVLMAFAGLFATLMPSPASAQTTTCGGYCGNGTTPFYGVETMADGWSVGAAEATTSGVGKTQLGKSGSLVETGAQFETAINGVFFGPGTTCTPATCADQSFTAKTSLFGNALAFGQHNAESNDGVTKSSSGAGTNLQGLSKAMGRWFKQ